MSNRTPPLIHRLYSVWYRHAKVFSKHALTNGFPPFVEPLLFLAGLAVGVGMFVTQMEGLPYLQYLSTGLIVTSAMFTAAFECSFGTYIRMEFEKIYSGMLGAPLTVNDVLWGEILWAGTKGLFFATAVLSVICLFGILPFKLFVVVPVIGLITGVMFASLSLVVTALVKDINQFNFYLSGFISPLFFFSGVIFPLSALPRSLRLLAEFLPLTHPIRLFRQLYQGQFSMIMAWDTVYILVFIVGFSILTIRLLKKKMIA